MVPTHFVQRSIELLREKAADALGRPIDLVVPGDPSTQQSIGIARQGPLGHARSSLLYSEFEGFCSSVSCATIYLRQVFDQLGRFDENLYVGEDVEFNQRFDKAGLRHYFSQELKCGYHPRRTYSEFARQMYLYGLGRLRSTGAHDAFSVSDFAPLVLVAGVVISIVAGIILTPWLAVPALAYAVAIFCIRRGLLYGPENRCFSCMCASVI